MLLILFLYSILDIGKFFVVIFMYCGLTENLGSGRPRCGSDLTSYGLSAKNGYFPNDLVREKKEERWRIIHGYKKVDHSSKDSDIFCDSSDVKKWRRISGNEPVSFCSDAKHTISDGFVDCLISPSDVEMKTSKGK